MKPILFNTLDYPLFLERPARLTDILSWQEHIPFAFTIVQMLRPQVLVELGTHKGDSYCAFCQAVQALALPCACRAVDTWEGDAEAGFYGPDVLEELRLYHDPLYGSFSRLVRSLFDRALGHFQDGSIDLLHIDGLHTYDAVRHDFESWLPKVSRRGVILLHDTAVHQPGFGVWRLWQELENKYPSFEFTHGNGLGVLGVGEDLTDDLRGFFSLGSEDRKAVADLFFCLGSRLTIENRLRKECEQREQLRERTIQDLTAHGEHLAAMMGERDGYIQSLTAHSANLEQIIRDQTAAMHDQIRIIGEQKDDLRKCDESVRNLESRLLACLEQNSLFVGQISELEHSLRTTQGHLTTANEHAQNLEKIVNHPLVRSLRRLKRAILVKK